MLTELVLLLLLLHLLLLGLLALPALAAPPSDADIAGWDALTLRDEIAANTRALVKKQRTWFAADKSGFHILHSLFQTSLQFDSIQRFDEYYATELLVHDGRCVGLAAIEMRSGQMRRFDAGAVIVAVGAEFVTTVSTASPLVTLPAGLETIARKTAPLSERLVTARV